MLQGAHGAISQLCHPACLAMSQLAAPCYRAACTVCGYLCASCLPAPYFCPGVTRPCCTCMHALSALGPQVPHKSYHLGSFHVSACTETCVIAADS